MLQPCWCRVYSNKIVPFFVLYTCTNSMVTVDLRKTKNNKLRHILSEHVGLQPGDKRIGLKLKKGVGGFIFSDNVGEHQIEYKVILELFPEGIGLYCRSRTDNFLVILPFSKLQRIIVSKEEDVIRAGSFSWYKIAMKIGISYERVRFLVLENEWVKEFPLTVTFLTKDNLEMKITMKKIRSAAVTLFFEEVKDKVNVDFDIKTFCLTEEV